MIQQRHDRLINDLRSLSAVAASSSILTFEAAGEAPERYELIFHGKGPCSGPQGQVTVCDEHRCRMHLSFSYPRAAPDLQWLTNLFHPNVSYGGFMQLEDAGLQWQADMSLEVVCERLWDVARMAYVNEHAVVNPPALIQLQETGWHLPLDERPLRDRLARQVKNVVRYRRRPEVAPELEPNRQSGESLLPPRHADDVLYIGDEEAE